MHQKEEINEKDIPNSVIEGLEEVRQSGVCNMFDAQSVFVELFNLEYYEAVNWLLDPKKAERTYGSQVDNKKYTAALNLLGQIRTLPYALNK